MPDAVYGLVHYDDGRAVPYVVHSIPHHIFCLLAVQFSKRVCSFGSAALFLDRIDGVFDYGMLRARIRCLSPPDKERRP